MTKKTDFQPRPQYNPRQSAYENLPFCNECPRCSWNPTKLVSDVGPVRNSAGDKLIIHEHHCPRCGYAYKDKEGVE